MNSLNRDSKIVFLNKHNYFELKPLTCLIPECIFLCGRNRTHRCNKIHIYTWQIINFM